MGHVVRPLLGVAWAIAAAGCVRTATPDDAVAADTDTDTDLPTAHTDTDETVDPETDPDSPTDSAADDTDAAVVVGPPPSLDGVHFSSALQSAISGCVPTSFGGRRAQAIPVAVADIDGDQVVEVLLANQICPNAMGEPIPSPFVRYDPALDALVVGESLASHLTQGTIVRTMASVSFLDVDLDGDADLVGNIVDGSSPDAFTPIWWNDGAGRFTPATFRTAGPAFEYGDGGPLGVTDIDGDGRIDLVVPVRSPPGGTLPLAVLHTADESDLWLEVGRFDDLVGISGWTFVPFSLHPTHDPWELLFAAGDPTGLTHDYTWFIPGGEAVPDTFVEPLRDEITGAVVDGTAFLDPTCGSASPGCLTPMGGSMMRLVTREAATVRSEDCLLVSTGSSAMPISVWCPKPAGDAFYESGPLGRSFAAPVSTDTTLAWLPSGLWDTNADGWMDVTLTLGRDAGRFPPMPQRSYLQTPGCFSAQCSRYVAVDLPMARGHHYGQFLVPVQDVEGAWSLLTFWSSHAGAEEADSAVQVVRWSVAEPARWIALQVGAVTDLRMAGAVVRPRFFDAAGRRLPGTEEVLMSVGSTVGAPGTNNPLILGVPVGAVRAAIEVDFAGCRSSVVVDGTELHGVWPVEIPDCP